MPEVSHFSAKSNLLYDVQLMGPTPYLPIWDKDTKTRLYLGLQQYIINAMWLGKHYGKY